MESEAQSISQRWKKRIVKRKIRNGNVRHVSEIMRSMEMLYGQYKEERTHDNRKYRYKDKNKVENNITPD